MAIVDVISFIIVQECHKIGYECYLKSNNSFDCNILFSLSINEFKALVQYRQIYIECSSNRR